MGPMANLASVSWLDERRRSVGGISEEGSSG
jgi:hypothetical protein